MLTALGVIRAQQSDISTNTAAGLQQATLASEQAAAGNALLQAQLPGMASTLINIQTSSTRAAVNAGAAADGVDRVEGLVQVRTQARVV